MPSTIGKCKLFRIKHITLLEGETFLRNKHEIEFFKIKCTFFGRKENTISFSLSFLLLFFNLNLKTFYNTLNKQINYELKYSVDSFVNLSSTTQFQKQVTRSRTGQVKSRKWKKFGKIENVKMKENLENIIKHKNHLMNFK